MDHKPPWFSMVSYICSFILFHTIKFCCYFFEKVLLYSIKNKFSFKTFPTLAPYSKSLA